MHYGSTNIESVHNSFHLYDVFILQPRLRILKKTPHTHIRSFYLLIKGSGHAFSSSLPSNKNLSTYEMFIEQLLLR